MAMIPTEEWTEYAVCFNCEKKSICKKSQGLTYNCPEFVEKKEGSIIKASDIQKVSDAKVQALKINNYLENVGLYFKQQPFFYDKQGMFWFWNKEKTCWEITDETDLMNMIEKELGFYGETIPSTIRTKLFSIITLLTTRTNSRHF